MSKIIGDAATIKRIQDAKPGDPCVYVNMEAVMNLPDDVEPVPVVIKFDPHIDFEDIGEEGKPSYYPTTKLMYSIAQERGITQIGDTITETLYEEVNISVQEMSPTPTIMKMKVGYKCTKTGATLGDDNTPIVRTHSKSFNAWDKCCKIWAKEEMYTEGYSKPSKYPNKYDTKWKRRMHFQKMLEHAWAVVDTQSWLKCIRDCACMLTAYTPEQLKEGKFYWIKIRRSEAIRKLETAARLDAIRNGGKSPALTAAQPREIAAPEATAAPDDFTLEAEVVQDEPPKLTEREQMHKDLTEWLDKGLIPKAITTLSDIKDELPKYVSKIIAFLAVIDAEKQVDRWKKAQRVHKEIKVTIPEKKPEVKEEERDIF
jgi:hypothetical protein